VILDKRQPGPDQSVSIDFYELAELVRGIRIIEAASGAEKKVHAREQQIRTWAFRSIVSRQPIKAGEIITQEMIWGKRPGTGIPSKHMGQIIGRRAKVDIKANALLIWDEVE